MGLVKLQSIGDDFKKTLRYLNKNMHFTRNLRIDSFGREGVEALRRATPRDTGETADSWVYDIEETSDSIEISWSNTNENEGVNIAVILQYGHGTGSGYYVQGTDYINPAMRDVFNDIAERAWKEVTSV